MQGKGSYSFIQGSIRVINDVEKVLRQGGKMKRLAVFGILCLAAGISFGTTRRVPSQYTTIQAAMDACSNNDTVLVAPGVYNETVNFEAWGVKLISEAGAESTEIHGNGDVISSSVAGMDTTALFEGFKVTGGSGGMGGEGGGLRMWNQQLRVRKCIFDGNTANEGAGLYLERSNAIVESCLICNNVSTQTGGGIYCFSDYGPYYPVFRYNTIINNAANGTDNLMRGAGAIALQKVGGTIIGNLIENNTATPGNGGIGVMSMAGVYNVIIEGNIIRNNDDVGLDFRYCGGANTHVNNNEITGHEYGIVYTYYTNGTIDATNNWWGAASGPYHKTLNPGGEGDAVWDTLKSGTQSVDFDPWLTVGIQEPVKPKEPPYVLSKSWPNPFLYSTNVKLESRFWTIVSAVVYDVTGKEVKTIMMNSPKRAGVHMISWDGRDARGKRVAPGMYFLRTKINNSSRTSKIVLLK